MAKNPGRTSVLIRMTPHQKSVLEREATKHGRSMNDVVLEFIDWLDRLPPGHKFVVTPTPAHTPVAPPSAPNVPHIEGQTEIPVHTERTPA